MRQFSATDSKQGRTSSCEAISMYASRPRRNPSAAWTQIGGELMAITPENSTLHRFNETGAFIWLRLDGQNTLAEIAAMLSREFDVPLEQAEADVGEFVARMAQQQLIEHTP